MERSLLDDCGKRRATNWITVCRFRAFVALEMHALSVFLSLAGESVEGDFRGVLTCPRCVRARVNQWRGKDHLGIAGWPPAVLIRHGGASKRVVYRIVFSMMRGGICMSEVE